jgi:hypothetical protein
MTYAHAIRVAHTLSVAGPLRAGGSARSIVLGSIGKNLEFALHIHACSDACYHLISIRKKSEDESSESQTYSLNAQMT